VTSVVNTWISVEDKVPTKYGKYLVYEAKSEKMYFKKWNGSGSKSRSGFSGAFEHVADALGIYLASRELEMVKMLESIR